MAAFEQASPVRAGEVLIGKYRVIRQIGIGGMGVVVAAEHLQLGQTVAMKFLLPEACTQGDAVARFLREARAAVQIRSEHVARVIDVGTLDTGAPYMVMEYLQGNDLSNVISSNGNLPVAEAIDFVLQACEAIAEAHSLGIVHRDLKPANLFLTQRADGSPLVKVLDFGISKTTGQGMGGGGQMSMTSTTAVMGSPLYMSPEQMRSSKNVDPRTDIWALGIILHELLAGRPVYQAETMTALLAMIIADPPQPIRHVRADVPAGVEVAILRCLEKDPSRRYPTVADLARALAPFGGPHARLSMSRIVGVTHSSSGGRAAAPSGGQFGSPIDGSLSSGTVRAWTATWVATPSSRPILPLLAGATLLSVLAGGAFWHSRASGETGQFRPADGANVSTIAPPAPPPAIAAPAATSVAAPAPETPPPAAASAVPVREITADTALAVSTAPPRTPASPNRPKPPLKPPVETAKPPRPSSPVPPASPLPVPDGLSDRK